LKKNSAPWSKSYNLENVQKKKYFCMNFIPPQNLHKSQPCNYKRVIVYRHSVQKLLSSSLLSKNMKIKIFCLLFCKDVQLDRSH